MPKVRLGSQPHGAQAELPVHESAVPKASIPSSLFGLLLEHTIHCTLLWFWLLSLDMLPTFLTFLLCWACIVVLSYVIQHFCLGSCK